MPKKIKPELTPDIIQTPLEDVMHQSMMPYAEYVILERAIPRVEDGLKPVQRRILYTMSELGLTPDKPHRKCARIVGDCLGKYHPHGDSSVYDALTRMAQPYTMRGIMVDGHGNFGSIDGDSAAAMRYTEARMAPLAMQMLRDIEKDTVPFRLNFDDTLKEPDLLPARFPNLLVNGASGIAVGLATNIPPHNLREVVKAACMQIDNPDITVDELMKVVPGPDFPTGGILLDTPELRTAYETGRAKITLRARVHFEDGTSGRKLLVITEVPYGIPKAQLLEKIVHLTEEKKGILSGIYDIRDESDRTGNRAVIELRKEADPQKVLNYLYKYSDLQITYGVNIVAVAEGKPVQMGLKTVLDYFIRHQKNVVTRRTQYELDAAKARAHILEGLIVAVDNLDEVIALIRASKNGKEAKERLMTRFGFTDIQAQAILDLRLQRLTGLEIEALRKEYADILKLIKTLEGILNSEKKLLAVIKKEVTEIADQYGDDRRTEIINEDPRDQAPIIEEKPAAEDCVVFMTWQGQLRRMAPRLFDKLEAPVNFEDRYRYLFRTQTDKILYLFTNKGNCYTLPVSALVESTKPKERGGLLSGLIAGLENGETCATMFVSTENGLKDYGKFCFVTVSGQIKCTSADAYEIRRSKFAAVTLKDGDSVLTVFASDGKTDIFLLTKSGYCLRFPAEAVAETGRASAGVRGIKLDDRDVPILAGPIRNTDFLLIATERGYFKRINGSMFDIQSRALKGVRSLFFQKNGATGTYIAAAHILSGPAELTVFQSGGTVTSLQSGDIPQQGLLDKGKPFVVSVMDDIVTAVLAQQ